MSEFRSLKNLKERDLLLHEGAKDIAQATIWTAQQRNVIAANLVLFSDEDSRLYFSSPEPRENEKFYATYIAEGLADCFVNLTLRKKCLFFKSKILGVDTAGLQFEVPEELFEIQRRREVRHRIPDGYTVKTKFQNPVNPTEVLERKVFDISVGGLSFLTDLSDDAVYAVDLALEKMRFTVVGHEINCVAVVRHKQQQQTSDGKIWLRVGTQLTRVPPASSSVLLAYVLEGLGKYGV